MGAQGENQGGIEDDRAPTPLSVKRWWTPSITVSPQALPSCPHPMASPFRSCYQLERRPACLQPWIRTQARLMPWEVEFLFLTAWFILTLLTSAGLWQGPRLAPFCCSASPRGACCAQRWPSTNPQPRGRTAQAPCLVSAPFTSGPDLNPCARTRTYSARTWTQSKPRAFQLRWHAWFLDSMKLRFLMSQHRKNSVRDKVIGKKWIYLETYSADRVGHLRRWEWPQKVMWLGFMGWVISWANEREDYSNYFGGGGRDSQELGHCPCFGLWWSALELSWCLWVYHLACWCLQCVKWGSGNQCIGHFGLIWF